MTSGLMSGKRGLVMGVANDHSIAWGIAKALAGEGAALAFTYQNDALGKRVAPLAGELGAADRLFRCDVEDLESVDAMFSALATSLRGATPTPAARISSGRWSSPFFRLPNSPDARRR